ncbi:hypothetical protein C8J56DRAFT_1168479 [Mycena floridula]|nr:hypothetical protein C8J56DRAFT_1168479 [Mycena floridula]
MGKRLGQKGFSPEDDEYLAAHIATHNPGMPAGSVTRFLKRLANNVNGDTPWGRKHSASSWSLHYSANKLYFDGKAARYLKSISKTRTIFTAQDDENLAKYLAGCDTSLLGCRSLSLYDALTANASGQWPWSSRHPSSSWNTRYKRNPAWFDVKILEYRKAVGKAGRPAPPLPSKLEQCKPTRSSGRLRGEIPLKGLGEPSSEDSDSESNESASDSSDDDDSAVEVFRALTLADDSDSDRPGSPMAVATETDKAKISKRPRTPEPASADEDHVQSRRKIPRRDQDKLIQRSSEPKALSDSKTTSEKCPKSDIQGVLVPDSVQFCSDSGRHNLSSSTPEDEKPIALRRAKRPRSPESNLAAPLVREFRRRKVPQPIQNSRKAVQKPAAKAYRKPATPKPSEPELVPVWATLLEEPGGPVQPVPYPYSLSRTPPTTTEPQASDADLRRQRYIAFWSRPSD